MEKYEENGFKLSMVIFLFILSTSILYSQSKEIWDIYLLNKTSDSVGQYDINVFVIGEVELDSLIIVSHGKYYINEYITKKSNIPYIENYKRNLNELIYNNDFFDFEIDYYVIRYFIYPQCNEYEKKRLDSTFAKKEGSSMIDLNYQNDAKFEINKSRKIYYYDIQGKNQYLLVVMNRTWRESRTFEQSDPPSKRDTSNTYIKFLIPLCR